MTQEQITTQLTVKRPSEVTDQDTFVALAVVRFPGSRIESCSYVDIWDDGYGPIWLYRCSIATLGAVRARTWESAYECATDEIMDDAECTCYGGKVDKYCPFHTEDTDAGLPEGYLYRSNGEPSNPHLHASIASYDLNGEDLSRCPDSTQDGTTYYAIVESPIVDEDEDAA
jgi:hypothetical protein